MESQDDTTTWYEIFFEMPLIFLDKDKEGKNRGILFALKCIVQRKKRMTNLGCLSPLLA